LNAPCGSLTKALVLTNEKEEQEDRQQKYTILKTLTSKELKEICKQHELRGFSGLKQKELAKFFDRIILCLDFNTM
jgi:hypothetical protein